MAGKFDGKTSALARNIADSNLSTVLGDDAITDAEAKAGSLAHWFGGVEGIKNARSIFHAAAAIHEFNDELSSLAGSADPQVALGGSFQDGVDSVVDEVKEDLL